MIEHMGWVGGWVGGGGGGGVTNAADNSDIVVFVLILVGVCAI